MSEGNSMTVTKREDGELVAGNMTVGAVTEQVALVQNIMSAVMKKDEHYGVIPGCGDKPSLLQPGAQKIGLAFKLIPEYEVDREDLPNEHREYEITCKLYHDGNYVGSGLGCCTTMETKYRYRKGSFVCPECGEETIIKGKKEFGGGWLCYKKKGGCGKKWTDAESPFSGATAEKAEHDNPADYYNTVKKMAMKRSYVSAILNTTACSDIFTQDIEDLKANGTIGNNAPTPTPQKEPLKTPKAKNPEVITVAQAKKLGSLMTAKEMTPEEMKALVKDVAGVETASQILKTVLPAIEKAIEEWVPAELADGLPEDNGSQQDDLPY